MLPLSLSRPLTVALLLLRSSTALASPRRPFGVVDRQDIVKMTQLEDVEIPPREYGYRTEPLEWPELIDIIDKEKNLAKLSRSVQQQKEYVLYQRELLKEWKSVYDHILVSKFDFEQKKVATASGGDDDVWEAYPPLDECREVRKTLKVNDFPYYFAPNIEHWCLWKLCEDVTNEETLQAKKELQDKYGDIVEYLSWKNPPHLKSLPDIDHVHILCLRRQPSSKTTEAGK